MSQIDLDAAGDLEICGALAIRSDTLEAPKVERLRSRYTDAQLRAIAAQAVSLLEVAANAGAARRPLIIGNVALKLRPRNGSQVLSVIRQQPATKIISIGTRGTAFANLSSDQMSRLQLNANNRVFYTKRSKEQMQKREMGEHQGSLWADSCSWVTPRGGEFWIGTIDRALAEGLVQKVEIIAKNGRMTERLSGYIRADFNPRAKFSKGHKIIAVETEGGRIEVVPVKKENSKSLRNSRYLRQIVAVEVEGRR